MKLQDLAQLLRDVAARTGWGPEILGRIEAAHAALAGFAPAPIQHGDAGAYLSVGPARFKAHGGEWLDGEAYVNLEGALFVRDAAGMAEAFQRLDMRLSQPMVTTPSKDELTDLIASGLNSTYHCTRVWSAWGVGTMSENDFEPVDESETPAELADAVLAMLTAQQPQQPAQEQAERKPRTDAEIVAQTEALAAKLNDWRWGASIPGNYRDSKHQMAQACWQMACAAQELLTDTDPENAAAELESDWMRQEYQEIAKAYDSGPIPQGGAA